MKQQHPGYSEQLAAEYGYKLENGMYWKIVNDIRLSAKALPNGNCPVGFWHFEVEKIETGKDTENNA